MSFFLKCIQVKNNISYPIVDLFLEDRCISDLVILFYSIYRKICIE